MYFHHIYSPPNHLLVEPQYYHGDRNKIALGTSVDMVVPRKWQKNSSTYSSKSLELPNLFKMEKKFYCHCCDTTTFVTVVVPLLYSRWFGGLYMYVMSQIVLTTLHCIIQEMVWRLPTTTFRHYYIHKKVCRVFVVTFLKWRTFLPNFVNCT